MKPSRLSFFNEQDPAELSSLVSQKEVRAQLRELDAVVTVGLRDFSDQRAEAVKTLRDDGVKVSAWLLLPREHGYFATHDNGEAVSARVDELLRWSELHSLRFERLGFDFEPDIRELDTLFKSPAAALTKWAGRSRNRARREAAVKHYGELISRVKSEGWNVESYQFPLLLEDRLADSHFFQRFSSSLDVEVHSEVVMAYSSLLGPLGAGLLQSWSPHARAIAVGSTGGGIDPLPKLSWHEFERDLRVAAQAVREVAVFSLEGTVERDWLPRLRDFDWSAPVSLGRTQRWGAASLRTSARWLAKLLR
ncbi:MAG: hypothetical protein ACO1OB_25235 [Archangium sp.]